MTSTLDLPANPIPRRSDGSTNPLTILHVVAPAWVGGLERVVCALARGHKTAGHHVHVAAILTRDDPMHPFLQELRAGLVDVHPTIVAARAYTRERAFVAELCRQIRPDTVHTHGYRPDVVDGGVARKLGIPTVSTVHGFTRTTLRGRTYEWLQRRALRRFAAVAAVSRPQVLELTRAGVPAARIHFIPNAWNGTVSQRLPDGGARRAFHIGWVGRLSREKGADILLGALAHMTDLPFVVSIIGDGPERNWLEAKARELGIAERVQWHGQLPDASRRFSEFDVFVLSSRTEGTPIVLFEAMAAGVPIVTAAIGGVPDVVSSAEALLVPSADPAALAGAIRRIHDEPAAALARAAAARKRLAQSFAPGPWLDRYEALYRQVGARQKT